MNMFFNIASVISKRVVSGGTTPTDPPDPPELMQYSVKSFGAESDGVTDDSTVINTAIQNNPIIYFEPDTVTILGSAISIPSNRRVVIGENAQVKLKNGAADYIFYNEDFVNGNTNIHIEGQGNTSIINGNHSGGQPRRLAAPVTDKSNYWGMGIYFHKVTNSSLKNVTIAETESWAVAHFYCNYIDFEDIHFDQTTLKGGGYNGDGITGISSNINIRNLTGYTNDDMVYIGAGGGSIGETEMGLESVDIENILIENVTGSMKNGLRTYRGVRVSGRDAKSITNITINNVSGDFEWEALEIKNFWPTRPGLFINNINVDGISRNPTATVRNVIYVTTCTIDVLTIKNLTSEHNVAETPIRLAAPIGQVNIDGVTVVNKSGGENMSVIYDDSNINNYNLNNILMTSEPAANLTGYIYLGRLGYTTRVIHTNCQVVQTGVRKEIGKDSVNRNLSVNGVGAMVDKSELTPQLNDTVEDIVSGIVTWDGSAWVSTNVYSTESTASFSHFTGTNELTTPEKVALNRFINGMVATGNWSKIKGLQLNSALSTAGKALIDLKSGVVAVNNGATYNPLTGFQTNGTSSYINTNLIPSELLDKDNVGSFIYPLADGTLISIGAVSSSPNTSEQLATTYNYSTKSLATKVSSGTTLSKVFPVANPMNKSWLGGTRLISNRISVTYNGDVAAGLTNTSVGLPRVPVYIGAQNFNGAASYGAGNYGAYILFDAIGFNYGALNFYFNQLMTELGVVTAEPLYNINDAPVYSNSEILLLNSEGQSNSLFAGKATVLNYTELSSPIVGANMYYSNPLGSTPVKGDLDYQVNHTNDGDATAYPQFAGGLRLSKELANQPLEYHIWAYNKSGTPLAEQAGKDWHPNSANEYFDESEFIGNSVMGSLTKPVKKLIWHWNQGEGDSTSTEAEYTADLYAYLNAKIGTYEAQGLDLSTVDFHVIITKIWSGLVTEFPGLSAVIAAQSNFSKANFEAAYPDHAGKIKTFTIYDNERTWHPDNVHLTSEGYHTEGYRLANYIAKL